MKKRLSAEREKFFWKEIKEICDHSRVLQSKKYCQHGTTSIYQHSLSVSYTSCLLAEQYHLKVDYYALIRGAFLHDYFLYDWHDKEHQHKRPHGFYHPKAALENAMEDFELTTKEQNIIKRHMFPLTVIPPAFTESWLVCIADKICSTKETLEGKK